MKCGRKEILECVVQKDLFLKCIFCGSPLKYTDDWDCGEEQQGNLPTYIRDDLISRGFRGFECNSPECIIEEYLLSPFGKLYFFDCDMESGEGKWKSVKGA